METTFYEELNKISSKSFKKQVEDCKNDENVKKWFNKLKSEFIEEAEKGRFSCAGLIDMNVEKYGKDVLRTVLSENFVGIIFIVQLRDAKYTKKEIAMRPIYKFQAVWRFYEQ